MIEILLFMFFVVICFFNYIKKVVFVVNIVVIRRYVEIFGLVINCLFEILLNFIDIFKVWINLSIIVL